MTLLKICGITDKIGLDACVFAGVDLLGFNLFFGSKRFIDKNLLEELITERIRGISVLVTVDMDIDSIVKTVSLFDPGYIQLHGREDLSIIKKLKEMMPGTKIIKKLEIGQKEIFSEFLEFSDYILCDAVTPEFGGSGTRFNWEQLSGIEAAVRGRLFLAGGVNAENIREALGYDIYAVDVASGSETYPGIKDPLKIEELVRKVREYEK